MKLGMEIPKSHATELGRLTDFDFAIAHRIVEDKEYRDFFIKQRNAARPVILDNGFHERGNDAKPADVLEADNILEADYVISPDRIDDPVYTEAQLEWSLNHFGIRTAGVIVGDELNDRMSLLMRYRSAHVFMICFPYRRPRKQWVMEFDMLHEGWDLGISVHMLGMQTLEEAEWMARRFPKGSIDTSKPIKWGYNGRRMDNLELMHGAWPMYDTFLDAPKMDADQSLVTLYNVALLRKALV